MTLNWCRLTSRQRDQRASFASVSIAAALVDTENRVFSGSAPLQVCVIDPLKVTRYDLYRATDQGVCRLSLPLAANDPAGTWTVKVRELLANTKGTASFTCSPPAHCEALAGVTQRAEYWGNDRENIFRCFRMHQEVTIVKGASEYSNAAADRLAEALKPWGVRYAIVNAADVNKPRELSEEEAKTWVGLSYAASGVSKAGRGNDPVHVGFDIQGPVVLLGTPEDNPLIRFLLDHGFLPYTPNANFPGHGRPWLPVWPQQDPTP